MRSALLAAAALGLAAAAAPAAAQAPAAPAAQASAQISDAELAQFAAAMEGVGAVGAQVQNNTPTAEQQAAMAEAITGAGLTIDRFNQISQAVSADQQLQARLAIAATPESPAGSVGASVTDAEVDQFVTAMTSVRTVAEGVENGAPTAEQQQAMAEAITTSGLTIERFNAISGALQGDPRLRARVEIAARNQG